MDNNSASCGSGGGGGDYVHDEYKCQYQISEPCNWFEGHSGPPKKKLKRLNVWDFFVKIGVGEDGKDKCKCKTCEEVYSCGSVATIALIRHIPKCPMLMKSHLAEGLVVRKLDQKVFRVLMTQMVIQHDLPFNFVEWEGFRAFIKYVSFNEAQCVSRDAVAANVMKVYLLEKEKLKKQLAAVSGAVCLSCRCWTSSTSSRGYIALTVHYMDENWKLNVKLLNFCHSDPPHDNFELSKKVFDCLCEWGIERKIFSITVDNASTNEDLQNLKKQLCLMDSLFSNGDYFHFRCCAPVLDLMVQESLKVVSDVLHKIRKSVKYVNVSNSRLQQLQQCVEEVGGIDGNDGLHLDVSAKWISTYLMLKSAVKYRHALERMRLKDVTYRHCPSSEQWERGEKICEFLGIFYGLTETISGSTYPMSDTHLQEIWEIEFSLKEMKVSEDDKIRDMASKMSDEFDKYWSEYSMIVAFGCALNPSLKFGCLEYAYDRLGSDTDAVKDKVGNVKKALNALLYEYVNKGASTSSSVSTSTDRFYRKFLEHLENKRQKKYAAGLTQLDLYLEEKHGDDLNAFDYWKKSGQKYGNLARLVRDVLSIPIITVASESPFSAGSCILNKYRSCIISENLQALVCSHNWLFGFSSSDRSEDMVEETRKN